MKIVGIDASTNKTGIAVFEDGKYLTHTLIDLHKITDTNKRIPKMMHTEEKSRQNPTVPPKPQKLLKNSKKSIKNSKKYCQTPKKEL